MCYLLLPWEWSLLGNPWQAQDASIWPDYWQVVPCCCEQSVTWTAGERRWNAFGAGKDKKHTEREGGDECVYCTFVSSTDIIRSLASLTFSLFPHTLMCGSAWGDRKRQTLNAGERQSLRMLSMSASARVWVSADKGQRQNVKVRHKSNPFNQTWQSSLEIVNKLQCTRQRLWDSNCCFDICRFSFESARKWMGRGFASVGLHSGNP